MRFPAPWDRALRVTTTILVLVLLAVLAPLTFFLVRLGARTGTTGATAAAVLVAAALAATFALAWGLAPRAFWIGGDRLRIERPLFAVDIPLALIRAAGSLPDGSFRGSIKVAGTAGLFGYYGRFWSRSLGAFRLYATRRTGLVVVDTADERFVISPDRPERFLEVLRQRAPAAARAFAETPVAPRPMPRRTLAGLAALVALVPVVVGGILLGVWAWSPRAVTVEDGEIHVERKLAPALVIPLGDVRSAERLAPEHGRFWRVAGTSIPGGVRYGHFRSRELGEVRLYAWRSDSYVLLETVDGRVIVTPDDPEAFVAAVRAGAGR